MIKKIRCEEINEIVSLEFDLKKPKGSENSANRLQEFHCSNEDNCKKYKEKDCPYISIWKK